MVVGFRLAELSLCFELTPSFVAFVSRSRIFLCLRSISVFSAFCFGIFAPLSRFGFLSLFALPALLFVGFLVFFSGFQVFGFLLRCSSFLRVFRSSRFVYVSIPSPNC